VLASSSKFPVALAIAGVVADGTLSFDTPIREVFDWWTQERFGLPVLLAGTTNSRLKSPLADPRSPALALKALCALTPARRFCAGSMCRARRHACTPSGSELITHIHATTARKKISSPHPLPPRLRIRPTCTSA
jgi:hypothetical protein